MTDKTNPTISASVLAEQAIRAAALLSGIEDAGIHLGSRLPLEVVEQLGVELGGRVKVDVRISGSRVEALGMMFAKVNGVRIEAQGSRPVTAGDIGLEGWLSDEQRRATKEEIRVAIGEAVGA